MSALAHQCQAPFVFPTPTGTSGSILAPWRPPVPGDSRSPCPALNSLANHAYLNHTGLDLPVRDIWHTVQDFYGLDGIVATLLTGGGLACCGHIFAGSLDLHELALHNRIEHDASLTHAPTIAGARFAPTSRDPILVERVISFSTDGVTLSVDDLARARVAAEDEAAAPLNALHARIGQGEVALTLLALGNGERVSVDRIRAWWGEDRLPADWTPPPRGYITLKRLNDVIKKVDVAMKAERGRRDLASMHKHTLR